jgi:hypothetical protein
MGGRGPKQLDVSGGGAWMRSGFAVEPLADCRTSLPSPHVQKNHKRHAASPSPPPLSAAKVAAAQKEGAVLRLAPKNRAFRRA